MRAIVSDSSPLICLCFLQREHLLHELFGEVLVPPAVAFEVSLPHPPLGSVAVERISGMKIQAPTDLAGPRHLLQELHIGERQAIALALELQADLLIIDEKIGRQVAQSVGLSVIGTLGILVRAKRRGLVPALRPSLDALRQELGFFVSQSLYEHILLSNGEAIE